MAHRYGATIISTARQVKEKLAAKSIDADFILSYINGQLFTTPVFCHMNFLCACILAVTLMLPFSATADVGPADYRRSAVAGMFYPGDGRALAQMIARLTQQAEQTAIALPADRPLRALIMPHAGYTYSGLAAAHAAAALKNRRFEKIIVMGPDHHVGFQGCAVDDVDAYRTPLGDIPLHPDARRLRRLSEAVIRPPAVSAAREHSVEVILPFLQSWLPPFSVIPMVTGRVAPGIISQQIAPLLDDKTLVIASSDLSHYLPYNQAVATDRETIARILDLETDMLMNSQNRACGKIPIAVVINLARLYNWEPILIHYSNSGDSSSNRDRVVGYSVIAFYGGQSMAKKITKKQGAALVQLARKTIFERLGLKAENPEIDFENDPVLQERAGTFVTLTIDGALRGCIGSLTADESIISGVKRNAVNAAFQDPRFPPLTEEEAGRMAVEVSILTEAQPLAYKNPKDLLAKLTPRVDGVIIQKGLARATFLPQVWEQLPDKDTFLEHLCTKAGLPPNAWEHQDLNVFTYQVQSFESKK